MTQTNFFNEHLVFCCPTCATGLWTFHLRSRPNPWRASGTENTGCIEATWAQPKWLLVFCRSSDHIRDILCIWSYWRQMRGQISEHSFHDPCVSIDHKELEAWYLHVFTLIHVLLDLFDHLIRISSVFGVSSSLVSRSWSNPDNVQWWVLACTAKCLKNVPLEFMLSGTCPCVC